MRTKTTTIVMLAAIALFAVAQADFSAHLTADQVVPPSQSTATGDASFVPNGNYTQLRSKVTVTNLYNDGLIQVAICMGRPGEPADVPLAILPLKTYKKEVFTGVLCSVMLTAADLRGPLEGQPLSSLTDLMAKQDVCINITSGAWPLGEIRGNIH